MVELQSGHTFPLPQFLSSVHTIKMRYLFPAGPIRIRSRSDKSWNLYFYMHACVCVGRQCMWKEWQDRVKGEKGQSCVPTCTGFFSIIIFCFYYSCIIYLQHNALNWFTPVSMYLHIYGVILSPFFLHIQRSFSPPSFSCIYMCIIKRRPHS